MDSDRVTRYAASPARHRRRWADLMAVDVASVCDLHNNDEGIAVANRVEHSIAALSNAVALLTGEFLAAGRARCLGERANARDDPPANFPGKGFEFLGGWALDLEPITCHDVSCP